MRLLNLVSICLIIFSLVLAYIALGLPNSFEHEAFYEFINSVFFITVISTLAAAFAGAYGAQAIIEKKQTTERIISELHSVNAAINIAFSICNSLIGIKKQYIKSIRDNFDRDKAKIIELKKQEALGYISTPKEFVFLADFRQLPPLILPTQALENQIFEKISANSRILSVTILLNQIIYSLAASILARNEHIQELQSCSNEILPAIYFGFPLAGKGTDGRYADSIRAIYNQTDDCIFFSELLCRELTNYGEKLKSKGNFHNLKIIKPDFSQPKEDGLMPDGSLYSKWLETFRTFPD